MKLRINGHLVRDVKECCSTDTFEPGQVLECNRCAALLRYGTSPVREHTEMVNNLEIDSDYVSTQIKFYCRE